MNLTAIKAKIRANRYYYSHHADIERRNDNLTLVQVEEALLGGEILEQYSQYGAR